MQPGPLSGATMAVQEGMWSASPLFCLWVCWGSALPILESSNSQSVALGCLVCCNKEGGLCWERCGLGSFCQDWLLPKSGVANMSLCSCGFFGFVFLFF